MQIFAKGSFSFGPGLKKDGTTEKFVTVPNVFMDMPDKFANDPLFQDCVKYGLVRATGFESNAIETDFSDVDPKQAELEEKFAQLKAMDIDQLVSKAEELEIHLTGNEKAKEIRRMIFAYYKKH